MLPFFPTKNFKDISDKLRGKLRRFRLPRSNGTLVVTGRLVSFFRHADFAEGLCPPAAGLVETLAVFKTRTGRFLVYYIVVYPELEYQTPRQEYARLCPDADALRAFLAAMAYPNKWHFAAQILAEVVGDAPSEPAADAPAPPEPPGASAEPD